MSHIDPQTWHHGLVARWWSLFNVSGPEIAYFRRFVEAGQPALDVACGSGRLLVPFLEAGLDVDGCDVSPDMIALCAEAAQAVGVLLIGRPVSGDAGRTASSTPFSRGCSLWTHLASRRHGRCTPTSGETDPWSPKSATS